MTISPATRALPGKRGRQTLQKIVDAAIGLFTEHPYRNVSVIDIARKVGTSPATVYQYFDGVEGIVLTAARPLAEETTAALAAFEDGSWSSEGLPGAVDFVNTVLSTWAKHHSLVRILTAFAAERDPRFVAAYTDLTQPVSRTLASAISPSTPSVLTRKTLVHNLVTALAAESGQENAGWVAGLSRKQRRAGLAQLVHTAVSTTA